jgi:hypothetical protein
MALKMEGCNKPRNVGSSRSWKKEANRHTPKASKKDIFILA